MEKRKEILQTMSKKAFTNAQIVQILEEGDQTDEVRAEFCRQ